MNAPVIGPNDKRTKVFITLPFTSTGEAAFDENGKPVGGREAVTFVLPRYDFLPRPQFIAMMRTVNDITKQESDETDERTEHEVQFDQVLALLKPVVEPHIYGLLEDAPLGVLMQINSDWTEGSSVDLGKLRASTRSSKNAKGRSGSTSSDTDSD
jgi:hypothetical protein